MVQLHGEARRKCLPMSSTWDCPDLGADSLKNQADLSSLGKHKQADMVPNLDTMQAWLAPYFVLSKSAASSADTSLPLNQLHSFAILKRASRHMS